MYTDMLERKALALKAWDDRLGAIVTGKEAAKVVRLEKFRLIVNVARRILRSSRAHERDQWVFRAGNRQWRNQNHEAHQIPSGPEPLTMRRRTMMRA